MRVVVVVVVVLLIHVIISHQYFEALISLILWIRPTANGNRSKLHRLDK